MLQRAESYSADFRAATDTTAGIIGLRFHRQFVIEAINDNFFAVQAESDNLVGDQGPSWEVLDPINLTAAGAETLKAFFPFQNQKERIAASALGWLLRAWTQKDVISKFVALFVPIETLLERYAGNLSEVREKQAKAVRELITTYGGNEKGQLLTFLEFLLTLQRPGLVSRFEQMAEDAKMNNWESDVTAFRRFNLIRNDLLHKGNPNVALVTSVGESLEDYTHTLEDMAE